MLKGEIIAVDDDRKRRKVGKDAQWMKIIVVLCYASTFE